MRVPLRKKTLKQRLTYRHVVTHEQIKQVSMIETLCFRRPYEPKDFYELCDTPGASLLMVADINEPETPIAYAATYHNMVIQTTEVHSFAVHPFYQGRGVGRFLLTAIQLRQHAAPDDCQVCDKIIIMVPRENYEARGFLNRLQFEEAGPQRSHEEEVPWASQQEAIRLIKLPVKT